MNHDELAFFSPLFLSIVCFLSGGIRLMLWSRNRVGYMLVSAVSWWAFCVYFGMLTVSAGRAPVVARTDIAETVRTWGFVVGLLVMLGKTNLLHAWWCLSNPPAAAGESAKNPPGAAPVSLIPKITLTKTVYPKKYRKYRKYKGNP